MPAAADPNLRDALDALGNRDHQQLHLGGIAAQDLAERFDTPLYVFSAQALAARFDAVRSALGPRVELLYSIKANPSLALTTHLAERGVGAEVASLGELHLALAAGHDAAALRFAGPGKTDAEIAAAVALGLGTFHVESADEIDTIAAAAIARGRRVRIAIRVNLPQELAGARMRMGGRSSRFGIDEAQVPAAIERVGRHPQLDLAGLHVYAGTQCFDANAFVQHAAAITERAARWEHELSVPLDELDLGGGFGVATFAGDPSFDLATAGRGLAALIAAHDRPTRRWFVELGRYLVAPCGVYLTRVVRTKDSGGERHAVLDGGMHQCAAAAGVGSVLKRAPLLVHAGDLRGNSAQTVTVGGPLCTPADQFAAALELPPLAAGDLIAILNAGAYGVTYSPSAFLSHAAPAEVMVEDGKARVVRERGDSRDVLRGQRR